VLGIFTSTVHSQGKGTGKGKVVSLNTLNAHGGAGVELCTMPVRLWVKYKIQFDILGQDM